MSIDQQLAFAVGLALGGVFAFGVSRIGATAATSLPFLMMLSALAILIAHLWKGLGNNKVIIYGYALGFYTCLIYLIIISIGAYP